MNNATDKNPTILDNDDNYQESEDEDFNPESVNKNEEEDGQEDDNDSDLDNKNDDYQDDEEKDLINKYKDLEGVGLIKTRAQRKEEEQKEKEYIKSQEKSSIDVNALWQELNGPKKSKDGGTTPDIKSLTTPISENSTAQQSSESQPQPSLQEEYITIKRTYKFAGQITTEEKRVLASSAEGKAYLKEQESSTTSTTTTTTQTEIESKPKLKSKPKGPKKRKSTLLEELEAGKAKKMNTLEKSRLDWLGFVDQEGIKDDLTRHNKGGYLQKQDFLSRVEHKIDQDIKNALKKN